LENIMGLLDGLLGAAMGTGQAQNPQGALLNAVLGMLSNGGAQGGGGLGGMLGGALGGGAQGGGGLGNVLGGMLGGGQQAGGMGALGGLLGMLQQSGLGQQADSWVSTGQNLPVSAEQIMQALGGGGGGGGADILGQLAQHAGMSREDAAGGLSQMLPDIVDKLTPNGSLPEGGIQDALGALSGLLKR
jgi:uncharacterized protein YidB (DUF937 family)